MKSWLMAIVLYAVVAGSAFAQKPAWVDNPGSYSNENFVGVGVAKDSKADKARDKAGKKAKAAVEQILKNKYPKKDVKSAMASFHIEGYYQDPFNKYYYALGLLPLETLDKDYAAKKKVDRARSAAMGAVAMLNAQTSVKDPDVMVMSVDEEMPGEMANESAAPTEEVAVKPTGRKAVTPVQNSSTSGGGSGTTDFSNKSFGSFKWIDQDQNSKTSFLSDPNLTANVAASESWDPTNDDKKAPRLEAANIKGNFVIEAKVKLDWEKYYNTGFGLYALSGKQNVRTSIVFNGSYIYLEGNANDIDLPKTEKGIDRLKGFGYLKLVREGYKWTAYYSTVAEDWVEIGNFETEFPETCNVGLSLFNWEGNTCPMKVEYVRIAQ